MQAEAHVPTARAAHYIRVLCRHFSEKAAATFTDTRGDVTFAFGTAELLAESDELILRVHAEDAERLQIAKQVVGGHLEEFAYRGEPIRVTWGDAATG